MTVDLGETAGRYDATWVNLLGRRSQQDAHGMEHAVFVGPVVDD